VISGEQVSEQAPGGLGVPLFSGVVCVAVMISESGSIAICPS
jgi:hypothetical protein